MRILCIGDSITFGTGSTPGNAYPDVLRRFLRACGQEADVVNAGIPAYSTKEYREYIDGILAGKNTDRLSFFGAGPFDFCVVMLGTNDCRLDDWVDTRDSLCNLEQIVLCFARRKSEVCVCSLLPLADPMPPDIMGGQHGWRQHRIESEFNPGIRRLAEQQNMRFVDIYRPFKQGVDDGLRLYDGIHPFDKGYRLIGELVGRALWARVSGRYGQPASSSGANA